MSNNYLKKDKKILSIISEILILAVFFEIDIIFYIDFLTAYICQ